MMTRFSLISGIAMCLLGCGPDSERPAAERPLQVGWSSLVNSYRDQPDEADRVFRGRLVQVYLPPTSYRVRDNSIESYLVIPERPGAIVFVCPPPPSYPDAYPILVTGRCVGRVCDGVERANKIDWHVRVEKCSVRELTLGASR